MLMGSVLMQIHDATDSGKAARMITVIIFPTMLTILFFCLDQTPFTKAEEEKNDKSDIELSAISRRVRRRRTRRPRNGWPKRKCLKLWKRFVPHSFPSVSMLIIVTKSLYESLTILFLLIPDLFQSIVLGLYSFAVLIRCKFIGLYLIC